MHFNQKWLIFTCILVINAISGTRAGRLRLIPIVNPKDSEVLRQTQNIFVQWVLSLLPSSLNGNGDDLLNSSLNNSSLMFGNLGEKPSSANNYSEIVSPTTVVINTPLPPTTMKPVISLVPERNCTECVCGIANTQKRIVGGQETEVNQYPWMTMLLYGGRFYCAATLINDQYLVTASHCVYGFRREKITVRLLEHDWKLSNIQKIDRRVMEIHTHPKYNIRTYDNDIAVLKLDKPVELTDALHPVCMPTPGKSFKGEMGIVAGWGARKVGGPSSETLQEVQVPVMSQDECRKSRYGPLRITDNMLCAGYAEGNKDSCQGDSGGPLHVISAGSREHQLAGVVSWGEGCAKAGFPGVYARVNRYGTWIKTVTKNSCFCHSELKKIK